jgi:hypothetical protein
LPSSNLTIFDPHGSFASCARSGEFRTWALDVADNASGGIVHELDSDLGNTSAGTYLPSGLSYFQSDSLLLAMHNIPVRPKTRVTFTSLTGTFEESIFAICESQFRVDDSLFWITLTCVALVDVGFEAVVDEITIFVAKS